MPISKKKLVKTLCFTSITIALDLLFLSSFFPTQAQQTTNQEDSAIKKYEGLPSNRRDGGSRSGSRDKCVAKGKDFVALVPDRPVNITASISSRLFFYTPQAEESKTVEFVLRNREDELIYKTSIQTTGEAGIMSIAIPEEVKNNVKEFHGDYQWYLSLICDRDNRSKDFVLEGWIEYSEIDNSLQEKINLSSSVEKSKLLQQEGIWYDALSVLAEQKLNSNAASIDREWSQLLESIGLLELASEPLIEGK